MAATQRVTYREATPDDVDAVRDVARETWEHDYPDVVNREAITDTVESWYDRDQLAADVRRGDAVVLVATTQDADHGGAAAADAENPGEEAAADAENPGEEAADDAENPGATGIVGFLPAVVDGDRGSVLRAYVHPDARGNGVGRGLVDAAMDAFRDRGCDRAEAMVLARNDPGNDFYTALGFERVGTDTTRIGGEGYDEHVYLKYL
jgi:ribosomal protein S18 acetylase RimI-like enzyme